MPTTNNGFPYPAPTDPIAEGAAAIGALAKAVDAHIIYGAVNISLEANDTPASASVTYAKPFSTNGPTPRVVLSLYEPSGRDAFVWVSATNMSGFTATGYRPPGAGASMIKAFYLAIGPVEG